MVILLYYVLRIYSSAITSKFTFLGHDTKTPLSDLVFLGNGPLLWSSNVGFIVLVRRLGFWVIVCLLGFSVVVLVRLTGPLLWWIKKESKLRVQGQVHMDEFFHPP